MVFLLSGVEKVQEKDQRDIKQRHEPAGGPVHLFGLFCSLIFRKPSYKCAFSDPEQNDQEG